MTYTGLAEIYVADGGIGEATILNLGFKYRDGCGLEQLVWSLHMAEADHRAGASLAKAVERRLYTILEASHEGW